MSVMPPEGPVPGSSCPFCGYKPLRLELRLQAKPLGTFSLAGGQVKFSATQWPWLVCDGCKADAPGEYFEDPE